MLKFGIILMLVLVLVLGSVFMIMEGIRIKMAEKTLTENGGVPLPRQPGATRERFSVRQPSGIAANDALAKSTLRTLSTASETFATVNKGYYPTAMDDLTLAVPPYILRDYCGETIQGYSYECDMWAQGYKFRAVPQEIGVTGTAIWIISTGGVLADYTDYLLHTPDRIDPYPGREEPIQRIEDPAQDDPADVRIIDSGQNNMKEK